MHAFRTREPLAADDMKKVDERVQDSKDAASNGGSRD
jgi:hypothetical protein